MPRSSHGARPAQGGCENEGGRCGRAWEVTPLLLMNPNGEQSIATQRELNLITDDKLAWLELP